MKKSALSFLNQNLPSSFLRFLDITALSSYFLIVLSLVLRHEPWADEAQAWLIARDTSLPEFFNFFFNNSDGHPILWYGLLKILTSFELPFLSQQILHFFLAFSTVCIFVLFAPFNRFVKYAWTFSYLMVYEYAVISRMYVLGAFFAFLIAALYPKRFQHSMFYACLVFLLFHSDFIFLSFALAVMICFSVESYFRRSLKEHWPAILLMGLGCLLALLQCFYREPGQPYSGGFFSSHSLQVFNSIPSFAKGFMPLASFILPSQFSIGVALILTVFTLAYLWRQWIPLFILTSTWAHLFLIFTFIHQGSVRHYGFFSVSLLFCLWISREHLSSKVKQPVSETKRQSLFYNIVLGVFIFCITLSIPGTLLTAYWEWRLPFSNSKLTAQLITKLFKDKHLDSMGYKIVAYPQTKVISPLAFMPHTKFWFPEINNFGSYYKFQALDITPVQVISSAGLAFGQLDKLLFLFTKPLDFDSAFGYRFQLVLYTKGAWGFFLEDFYLYRAVRLVKV